MSTKTPDPCSRCGGVHPEGLFFLDTKLCPSCDAMFYDWRSRSLADGSYNKAVSDDHLSLVAHWKEKVAPYAKAP